MSNMIKKTGTLSITAKKVKVEGFAFKGTDFNTATIEALEWGVKRLREEIDVAQALIEGGVCLSSYMTSGQKRDKLTAN